MAEVTNM